MQFLFPYFLWALAALAVPVVIHLFYFKRFKKVYFSNVKYLKEIKEETSNRNKIKEWLILLARLLAFTALIFAFAQPFIPTGEKIKQGKQLVSIFIDNSFSMSGEKENIPLLDVAKEKAVQIVDTYGEEALFQVLTHELLGRHQRLLSREDALAAIEEVQLTSLVQPLSKVINREYQLLKNEEGNKIIYTITDCQASIFDLNEVRDSIAEINIVPIQSGQAQNVSLDSVWMENQIPLVRQPNYLFVKMTNHSSRATEQVRLSLFQDGQEKPIRIHEFEAGGTRVDTIPVVLSTRGTHKLVLKISDYPVQFDDTYSVVLDAPDSVQALRIYEKLPNAYVSALFKGLAFFGLKNQDIKQIQYQDFDKYNLIILEDISSISSGLSAELNKYITSGGKVVIFPSLDADIQSFNSFLQSVQAVSFAGLQTSPQDVSKINTEEYIFKDVFSQQKTNQKLPRSFKSFRFQNLRKAGSETILTNRDGSPFLMKNIHEKGIIYVCGTSLNEEASDLVKNAEIFVPMIYKMAIAGVGSKQLSYTISNHTILETKLKGPAGDEVFTMKSEAEFIPGQRTINNRLYLETGDQIRKAGFVKLFYKEDTLATFAFNYDRRESDTRVLSSDEIENLLGENPLGIRIIQETEQQDLSNSILAKDKGITLWKYFLLAALIFLLVEILLIRFWR